MATYNPYATMLCPAPATASGEARLRLLRATLAGEPPAHARAEIAAARDLHRRHGMPAVAAGIGLDPVDDKDALMLATIAWHAMSDPAHSPGNDLPGPMRNLWSSPWRSSPSADGWHMRDVHASDHNLACHLVGTNQQHGLHGLTVDDVNQRTVRYIHQPTGGRLHVHFTHFGAIPGAIRRDYLTRHWSPSTQTTPPQTVPNWTVPTARLLAALLLRMAALKTAQEHSQLQLPTPRTGHSLDTIRVHLPTPTHATVNLGHIPLPLAATLFTLPGLQLRNATLAPNPNGLTITLDDSTLHLNGQ